MSLVIYLILQIAFASSAGHGGGHHDEGIPTVVWYQAINVSLFFGLLFWFSKDKVRAVFQQRLADFNRLAQETEKARKDLENKKSDLQRRASELSKNSQQSLSEAKAQAQKMYLEEVEKSKKQAVKIEQDVETQIQTEQQKLIEKLRLDALEMSVGSAEKDISHMDANTQQKINKSVQQRIEGATL